MMSYILIHEISTKFDQLSVSTVILISLVLVIQIH